MGLFTCSLGSRKAYSGVPLRTNCPQRCPCANPQDLWCWYRICPRRPQLWLRKGPWEGKVILDYLTGPSVVIGVLMGGRQGFRVRQVIMGVMQFQQGTRTHGRQEASKETAAPTRRSIALLTAFSDFWPPEMPNGDRKLTQVLYEKWPFLGLTSFSAWTTSCTEVMETVLWSGLISLGSVWGIDAGLPPPPHQKHIDNVHPLCSDGSRLAFCSLFEGSNYLHLLFRASSFPEYQDDNKTPQSDPLLPEDLFSHIAFPFSITKCLEGEVAW